MGNDRTFKLLGEVMSFLGSYSAQEFAVAREYVKKHLSPGKGTRGLDSLLDNLIHMSDETLDTESSNDSPHLGFGDPISKVAIIEAAEAVEKELSEMLLDSAFLEDRQSLVQFISRAFDVDFGLPDPKSSRASIIRKAVNAFRKLSRARQQEIFSAVQRSYLRERESGLASWSKSIARKEK